MYKSSRISATQRPIRDKFGTNVEKGRLVRNPQKILEILFADLWSLSAWTVTYIYIYIYIYQRIAPANSYMRLASLAIIYFYTGMYEQNERV